MQAAVRRAVLLKTQGAVGALLDDAVDQLLRRGVGHGLPPAADRGSLRAQRAAPAADGVSRRGVPSGLRPAPARSRRSGLHARRLDGRPWEYRSGERLEDPVRRPKSKNLFGSQGNWPIGILEATGYPAIGLVEVNDLRRIWRIQRWEFWLSMVCFAGVAVLGAIPGIGLAIAIAVIEFLWDGWRPHSAVLGRADGVKGYHDIMRYPDARRVPGLVLFRWDAPLFFANAEFFRERVLDAVAKSPTAARWLVVAAEPVTSVDVTACVEPMRVSVHGWPVPTPTRNSRSPVPPVPALITTYFSLSALADTGVGEQ